jgi:hypothetical protein
MLDKPLHVQVAEALGCLPVKGDFFPADESEPYDTWHCHCRGVQGHTRAGDGLLIPRYDTDWSATGPLIEKYGIELAHGGFGPDDLPWLAAEHVCSDHDHNVSQPCGIGPTPLIAVCHLILALRGAGKL